MRTPIPFLLKYVVPHTERVDSDFLEFAVPEIADVVSSRKNSKTAAMCLEKQNLIKHLGSGSRLWIASKVFPTKSAKETGRSRGDFYKHSSRISQLIFGTNNLLLFLDV